MADDGKTEVEAPKGCQCPSSVFYIFELQCIVFSHVLGNFKGIGIPRNRNTLEIMKLPNRIPLKPSANLWV
jgi:hypothetical protein